jgi:hypothetical protein
MKNCILSVLVALASLSVVEATAGGVTSKLQVQVCTYEESFVFLCRKVYSNSYEYVKESLSILIASFGDWGATGVLAMYVHTKTRSFSCVVDIRMRLEYDMYWMLAMFRSIMIDERMNE